MTHPPSTDAENKRGRRSQPRKQVRHGKRPPHRTHRHATERHGTSRQALESTDYHRNTPQKKERRTHKATPKKERRKATPEKKKGRRKATPKKKKDTGRRSKNRTKTETPENRRSATRNTPQNRKLRSQNPPKKRTNGLGPKTNTLYKISLNVYNKMKMTCPGRKHHSEFRCWKY